jgi:nickel-dependent lactate racemase
MARYQIPYSRTTMSFSLPDGLRIDYLSPADFPAAKNPIQLVSKAIAFPLGSKKLSQFTGIRSVAIALNDKTRPVPHKYLLPPLLEELEQNGVKPEQIKLIIATGAHPVMPPEEYSRVIPPRILDRYLVKCHDASDEENLVFSGQTTRGTPVFTNKHFMRADLRLVVGNIEPHQFQGFSGGVKSAAIGLAGRRTINHNHSLMSDANAHLGIYEQNPARQDVEEIGQIIKVDFALNAILNENKEIIHVVAGDPRKVMQTGIPLARQVCQIKTEGNYDLVIASPGGYPKDINLYQAQKGLAHACMVTRPGGVIILAAACPEGSGSQAYETWMQGMRSFNQVIERFLSEGFQIGPHKAYQIARDASYARLMLLSDMPPGFVRSLLIDPVDNLQHSINEILQESRQVNKIAIMPRASSTIPDLV